MIYWIKDQKNGKWQPFVSRTEMLRLGGRKMEIKPQGKQLEVYALPAEGHIVVLGTAGSGKTTIAMLRARHLAKIPRNGNVLLVTFNGALTEYMRKMSGEAPGLTVENYHTFARGYLNSRGKMPRWHGIASPGEKAEYIGQAVKDLRSIYPSESTLKRPNQFFVEEITFMEKFGLSTETEYQSAERIGRAGANIKRENRKWIFLVYQKYLQLRQAVGLAYDWDDLALCVRDELRRDPSPRRYSHIIVDEGQDFSPMMLQSLIEAVGEGGSFTFFGDVAQQIYGSRLSWRDSGIRTSKIWRFDANYRNPESIVAFSKTIPQNRYWRQDSDMVESTFQIAKGPKPVLIHFPDKVRERKWIVKNALAFSRTGSVVIICRNRADLELFEYGLKCRNCVPIEIDRTTPGFASEKQVYLATYHAAKGLEFEHVFIPYLSADKLPDPDVIEGAASEEDACADEIRLLYVAVTRSRNGLYMTYSGKLTPLFPPESDTYEFLEEKDL